MITIQHQTYTFSWKHCCLKTIRDDIATVVMPCPSTHGLYFLALPSLHFYEMLFVLVDVTFLIICQIQHYYNYECVKNVHMQSYAANLKGCGHACIHHFIGIVALAVVKPSQMAIDVFQR